ncbi:hypothetical protein CPB83DRAFT_119208 [Crepidotus variabilis]|uniref:Uncharacterized protein n=1 Tax=Crepidotus variabilis TaxID=179855 RepID=A0A9P6JSR4_9AGAR|nr:hypothetical protein CPB83DRAFT_119208 [Crepidotus variabilis]
MDMPDSKVLQSPAHIQNDSAQPHRNVDWTQLNDNIFDLIDHNKQYRDVLFSDDQVHWRKIRKSNPEALLKGQCIKKLAENLLSTNEANVTLKHLPINVDLTNSLRGHLNALQKQYQRINEKLGSVAASKPYEDFVPGTEAYTTLERLTAKHSWWKRAHVHWRTISSCNPLYQEPHSGDNDQSKLQPNVRGVRSSKTDQKLEIIDVDELSDEETIYVKRDVAADPITPPDDSLRRSKRGRKRKSFPDEDNPVAGPSVPRGSSIGNDAVNNHNYELEMAELTLKRQKLENDAIEKKAGVRRLELEAEERRRTAETERAREKERHEFMMRLMEMAMPSKNPPGP